MPSLITSVSLFIRGSSRRVALAFVAFVIIVFTLSNTPSRDLRSIPHESYHHEAVVESSHTPFRPESCDPHAFPSDSMQKKLLNPPIAIHDFGPVWGPENHRQFKALCNCLVTNSCAPNQDKVVLISANHFEPWYSGSLSPRNGGESVWATSTIEALRLLGYTFLYAGTPDDLQKMYRVLAGNTNGDGVPAIIMSDEHIFNCWDEPNRCVKSSGNPDSPPIWKFFSFHFWPNAQHPLGHSWTLSPEDYSPIAQGPRDTNTFLGYSIEPSCDLQPFIPHEERVPGRVYAMTKRLSYFAPQPNRAWPPSFFASAARRVRGVQFTIGAANDTKFAAHWHLEIPQMSEFGGEGVMKNLGLLERDAFVREVARSKVLLGVGRPAISPTPYQALCLGVPFINPILDWDPQAPNEPKTWNTQHNGLRELRPPYVYNVHKDDEVGFLGAIARALDTPIPRYIPPGKSLAEVAARLHTILQRDWRQEAEELLGERIRTKKGERFTL